MNKLATSMLLAYKAYAVAGVCTTAQRVAQPCSWLNECTTEDGTGSIVITCAPSAKVCANSTECVNETGYCDTTTVPASPTCAYCTDAANCNTVNVDSQCPTDGTKVGICTATTAGDACFTAYATTQCNTGQYCNSALVCADSCPGAVCTETDEVCQTMTSMCTPACTVDTDCVTTYGAPTGTLCGTAAGATAMPSDIFAGICYAPLCTASTTCNFLIQTCPATTGYCTAIQCTGNTDPTPCNGGNGAGMKCATNGNCAVCTTSGATECSINETCDTSTGADATGACSAITCVTANAYDASACFASGTVCVAGADPAAGACAICDNVASSANNCSTGYTCNTINGNDQACTADACGDDTQQECDFDYQMCSATNTCANIACTSAGTECAANSNLCVNDECVGCDSNNACPSASYCNNTLKNYGVCTTDCTDDTGCNNWETCATTTGQCVGKSCTASGVAAECAGPNASYAATCVAGNCTSCTATTTGSDTECPDGQFCSVGQTAQASYASGVCYPTECSPGNTDCDNVTKQCDADFGLCVDIPCTPATVAADCPKTMVCSSNLFCAGCTIDPNGTSSPTSTCPALYWCNAVTTACYLGECAVATQDVDCSTITESCDGTTLLCTQQTCAANVDCRSGLCEAATADSNCIVCADNAACQATTTGGDATMYCATATGTCFAEACVGAASTPAATDNCAVVANTCQNGVCAATTGCTAEANTCRSNADGSGTEGVCTVATGACAACSRTTVDTVTTSDCPAAMSYCNTSNAAAGNYCTLSTCAMSAATLVEPQVLCSADQVCLASNTGACGTIACATANECDTKVCTDAICAQCDAVDASGNQCPETDDDSTWYTCDQTTGVCAYNEDTGISGGGIAGIIIGSVVFLGAVVGLTLYCCKKDSKSHDAMQEALK